MESANIVIIGAGVIGLAIAARLSSDNDDIYVLEKNQGVGLETSTHNSGVIHSGIHYPLGSLKARLCVTGNKMIYEICEKNGIPSKKLGKLTVATNEYEIASLKKLYENGRTNGVSGMKFLERSEIKNMEENVDAEMALYTPTSGIVEQDYLIHYFYSESVRNGANISTGTIVTGITHTGSGYELTGTSVGHSFRIKSRTVINCAGLYSDRIAALAGLDINALGYKLHYYKGDYYRVVGKAPVKMLVYPVPEGPGLGIHLTPDMSGSVKLGPNAYPVTDVNYTEGSRPEDFKNDVMRFLPKIKDGRIEYDSSGIRPKLSGKNGEFRDFIIHHESDHGLNNFIDLIGIESPGFTASPAIARYVEEIYKREVS